MRVRVWHNGRSTYVVPHQIKVDKYGNFSSVLIKTGQRTSEFVDVQFERYTDITEYNSTKHICEKDIVKDQSENFYLVDWVSQYNAFMLIPNPKKSDEKAKILANNLNLTIVGTIHEMSKLKPEIDLERHQEFTLEEDKTIQRAKVENPLDYLRSLRDEAGGFVLEKEIRVIHTLYKRNELLPEVVNILIYHVCVFKKKSSLQSKYVMAIHDDWVTQKIDSAEKAMAYVKRQSVPKRMRKHISSPESNANSDEIPKVSDDEKRNASLFLEELREEN